VLLTVCTLAYFYCLGVSWLLQVVVYPTYRLVGAAEFVPFHVSQGRRMIPVLMVPMTATAVLSVVTAVLHRAAANAGLLWGVAACAAIVIGTTLVSELPKHLALDKGGKNDQLINGLVRDNLPRSLAWTVGCILLMLANR
jgi:hypothetical protein